MFRRRQLKFVLQMFFGACWGVVVGRLMGDHPVIAILVSVFGAIVIWSAVNQDSSFSIFWRSPYDAEIDEAIQDFNNKHQNG